MNEPEYRTHLAPPALWDKRDFGGSFTDLFVA